MQPPPRRNRQIVRDLRPDRPLVYERLSDPILVRRVKDGDQLALAALCARHADRVHRIALHVLRDPEDANDAAQESMVEARAAREAVPRRLAVLDVAAPPGRQHLQGRRAGALGGRPADGAAARGHTCRARRRPGAGARGGRDTTRARRAAWPSCPPPRRASSRSRTRSTRRSTRSRRRRGCPSERPSATRTEGARRSGRSSPHERRRCWTRRPSRLCCRIATRCS